LREVLTLEELSQLGPDGTRTKVWLMKVGEDRYELDFTGHKLALSEDALRAFDRQGVLYSGPHFSDRRLS
jgi:hypothetical protein